MTHHALELHAVQTEGSIAVQDENALAGARQLRRHRIARARAKTAHWPGIQPVAWARDIDDAATVADNIAAIADHRRLLIDEITYLAAEAHGVYRHSIGIERSLVALLALLLLFSHIR